MGPATFFHGDWSWNTLYSYSLPFADFSTEIWKQEQIYAPFQNIAGTLLWWKDAIIIQFTWLVLWGTIWSDCWWKTGGWMDGRWLLFSSSTEWAVCVISWVGWDEHKGWKYIGLWCLMSISTLFIMHIQSLVKICLHLLMLSSERKIWMCGRHVTCQKLTKFGHSQSQTRSAQYQCIYQVWWKSIDMYSCYHQEMKIWMCGWKITIKNWWNFAISNPKPDLHNINAHFKFGENPLIFTQVIARKQKNTDWRWPNTLTSVKP